MTQHTPTPWTYDTSLHIYGHRPRAANADECAAGATEVIEQPHVGTVRHSADAALITRAVNAYGDLLAACKAARQRICPFGDPLGGDIRLVEQLDAAIAKAAAR